MHSVAHPRQHVCIRTLSLLCLVLLPLLLSIHAADNAGGPSVAYTVQHSFDAGVTWTERGVLRNTVGDAKRLVYKPTVEWTEEHMHQLLNRGVPLYQVRLLSEAGCVSDGKDDGAVVVTSTSVNACDLLESEMREVFLVETVGEENRIAALTVYGAKTMPRRRSPLQGACLKNWVAKYAGTALEKSRKHAVKVVVNPGAAGHRISYKSIQQMEQRQKEVEHQKDEPGFLRKYWYYLLPVAIILLMGVLVPEPPPQEQQQQGVARPS